MQIYTITTLNAILLQKGFILDIKSLRKTIIFTNQFIINDRIFFVI